MAAAITVTAQEAPHFVELGDDTAYWTLLFRYETEGITATFESQEPYMFRLSEWMAFAQGDAVLGLYQGNGDGSIRREGDAVTFTGEPSGAGGDVVSKFTMRWEDLAAPFLAAMQAAQAANFHFRAEA